MRSISRPISTFVTTFRASQKWINRNLNSPSWGPNFTSLKDITSPALAETIAFPLAPEETAALPLTPEETPVFVPAEEYKRCLHQCVCIICRLHYNTPSRINDIDPLGPDSGAGVTPTGLTGANDATGTTQMQRIPPIWTSSQDRSLPIN